MKDNEITHRVLIVDDQHEVRSVLRDAISTISGDIKVLVVPSAEEAMLIISRQHVDLLVIDIRLPGISGLEFEQRARIRNPDLKIIMITGMTDEEIRKQAAETGAEAVFYKPIEMPEFLKAVQDALDLAELPAQLSENIIGTVIIRDDKYQIEKIVGAYLASLREKFAADCGLIIDTQKQVMEQLGDFPGDIDQFELIQRLKEVRNGCASLSSFLGAIIPENVILFSTGKILLLLADLGFPVDLVLLWSNADLKKIIFSDLLLNFQEIAEKIRKESQETNHAVGIGEDPGLEAPSSDNESDLVDLAVIDEIFSQAQQDIVGAEEMDTYWDQVANEESGKALNEDVITYEQARRMDIAPDEE